MDITQAQFADFNNTAGRTTFSYAQLLAQLQNDITGTGIGTSLGCSIRAAGAQSIPTGTFTEVTFDVVTYDDAGFVPGGDASNNIVIPATPAINRVGISVNCRWSSGGTGFAGFQMQVNSLTPFQECSQAIPLGDSFTRPGQGCVFGLEVVPGDEISLEVVQTSGGNFTLARADMQLVTLS